MFKHESTTALAMDEQTQMKTDPVHDRTMIKKYFAPIEIQNVYGISENTLANWRHERKGPKYYKVGGMVKYNIDEFDDWIKAQEVTMDF